MDDPCTNDDVRAPSRHDRFWASRLHFAEEGTERWDGGLGGGTAATFDRFWRNVQGGVPLDRTILQILQILQKALVGVGEG